MRKIGILGGVGWRASAEYYAGLCRLGEAWRSQADKSTVSPVQEISIESLDQATAIACLGVDGDEASWSRFDAYHRDALQRLQAAGAEFAIMASVTPHHRHVQIVRGVDIPVIDLFEAVARKCARIGVRQLLILGTSHTMASAVFRAVLARHGVEGTAPHEAAARSLTAALITQLQHGNIDGVAARLGDIAKASFAPSTDTGFAACLACTELPLAFPENGAQEIFETAGVTYLNAAAIHIAAAFERAVTST